MNYVSRLQQWLIWRKKQSTDHVIIWMKVVLAVMCTTWAVVKIRPDYVLQYGIWTHDLCDTGAALYQLSQQANWELVIMLFIHHFTGLFMGGSLLRAHFFTTAQVVHITARITFIHVLNRSSNIWLSYILSRSCNYSNLPWEVLVLRWQF